MCCRYDRRVHLLCTHHKVERKGFGNLSHLDETKGSKFASNGLLVIKEDTNATVHLKAVGSNLRALAVVWSVLRNNCKHHHPARDEGIKRIRNHPLAVSRVEEVDKGITKDCIKLKQRRAAGGKQRSHFCRGGMVKNEREWGIDDSGWCRFHQHGTMICARQINRRTRNLNAPTVAPASTNTFAFRPYPAPGTRMRLSLNTPPHFAVSSSSARFVERAAFSPHISFFSTKLASQKVRPASSRYADGTRELFSTAPLGKSFTKMLMLESAIEEITIVDVVMMPKLRRAPNLRINCCVAFFSVKVFLQTQKCKRFVLIR